MNLIRKIKNKWGRILLMTSVLVLIVFMGGLEQTYAKDTSTRSTSAELNSLYFSTNIKTGTYITTANDVRESMSLGNTQRAALDVSNMAGIAVTYGDFVDSVFAMQTNSYSPAITAIIFATLKTGGSPIGASEIAGTIANNTIYQTLGKDMTNDQARSDVNLMNLKQSLYDSIQAVFSNPDCVQKMRDAHNMYKGQDNYQSIMGCVRKITDNSVSAFTEYYKKTTTDPTKLNSQIQSLNNLQTGNINSAKEAPGKAKAEEIYCVQWSKGVSIPGCIAIVSYFILFLTSWVLFIAALAFDYTINYSLGMYDIISNFKAIQYGWETFRNLINLFFILILVYIAIATILRLENYGYKKLLGKLVIAAFLINFSMFFTEVIIDASNIVTLVFYKQIMIDAQKASNPTSNSGVLGATANTSLARAKANNQYISFGIMSSLGLQSVWGVVGDNGGVGVSNAGSSVSINNNDPASGLGGKVANASGSGATLNPWMMTLVGLGGSIFVLILAFIFFAAAIMFLFRLIILIVLIITSPIAFAANILPKTESQSKKWWSKLISNTLFAPVYMMLMFVTLKMVWGGTNKVNVDLLSLFTGGDVSFISVIFYFVLICGMLVMCLVAASSIGALGAKTLHGWAQTAGTGAKKWGKNFAINRATSPISYLADKASKSKLLARMPGGGILLQGADKLAQSKLGGDSSYRSRLKDSKETYSKRGDLIKNAVTGELSRRIGESEPDFQKRKTAYENKGRDAQKSYFGIGSNGVIESDSLFRGKQQAREAVLESASKITSDKGSKIITQEKEAMIKIIDNDLVDVMKGLGDADADMIKEHINNGQKIARKNMLDADGKEIIENGAIKTTLDAKNIKNDHIYDLIEKMTVPIKRVMGEIKKNEDKMLKLAEQNSKPATNNATRKSNIAAIESLRIITDMHKSRVADANAVKAKLEAKVKRVEDTEIQKGTQSAIEKSAPKPDAK